MKLNMLIINILSLLYNVLLYVFINNVKNS